jgi:hypothetical protein
MAERPLTNILEVWKPIPGFSAYEASEFGHIRRRRDGKILGQHLQRGYYTVKLGRPRIRTSRAVCAAFHGPAPSRFHYALHGNGNPKDNRAVNLRWGTQRENCADKYEHGTAGFGEQNPFAKLNPAAVSEIRRLCEGGRYGGGARQTDVAAMFGISQGTVSQIVTGKTWAAVE